MESCKQVQALVLVAVLLIGNGSAAPVNGRIAGLTSAAAATDNYVDFLKDLRTGLDIAQDIAVSWIDTTEPRAFVCIRHEPRPPKH